MLRRLQTGYSPIIWQNLQVPDGKLGVLTVYEEAKGRRPTQLKAIFNYSSNVFHFPLEEGKFLNIKQIDTNY